MSNFFGHLHTILHHKRLVAHYCFLAGIPWHGLTHDLSKFSPAEFWVGVRYYQGNRSPNEAERQATGMSRAWLHHKGRNKHHFEYWVDYNGHGIAGMEMPPKYLAEMFCDRIAASRTYQGSAYTDASPYEYYQRSHSHYIINENTDAALIRLLTVLKDQGEAAAFSTIRTEILHKKK